MKSSDSTYSICFLQKGFREKRFTPMDVTQHALKQARAHSQIFTQVCEKEALLQANESTQRWRHGTPASELDGIPFAVKDLFDIKGYATTRGSTLYSALSDSTSPQVLALIESGAVLIGKTNLSEFAYSGLGLNPHFGTPTQTYNDNAYITGGSSCGSAAAVLENIVPFTLGTDTAGSIRIPSSYCGLVGFRASRKRYDNRGIAPLSPSLDTTGPIGHCVDDILLVDSILYSPTEQPAGSSHSGLVFDAQFCQQLPLDCDTRRAFDLSLDALQNAGVAVEDVRLSTLDAALDLIKNIGWLGSIEAYLTYEDLVNTDKLGQVDPLVAQRLAASNQLPATQISYLYQQREKLQQRLSNELAGRAFLMPTTLTTAPLLSQVTQSVESFNEHNINALRLTMIGSYLDCPGIALPNGYNSNGLPTSLLLSQCSGNDDALISLAKTIEPAIASLLIKQSKGNNHG